MQNQEISVSIPESPGELSNNPLEFQDLLPIEDEFGDFDTFQNSLLLPHLPVNNGEYSQENQVSESGITLEYSNDLQQCFSVCSAFEGSFHSSPEWTSRLSKVSNELSYCFSSERTLEDLHESDVCSPCHVLEVEELQQSEHVEDELIPREKGEGGFRPPKRKKIPTTIVVMENAVEVTTYVTTYGNQKSNTMLITNEDLDSLEKRFTSEEACKHLKLGKCEFSKVREHLGKRVWNHVQYCEETLPVESTEDKTVQSSKGHILNIQDFRQLEQKYTKADAVKFLGITYSELTTLHRTLGMTKWDHFGVRISSKYSQST